MWSSTAPRLPSVTTLERHFTNHYKHVEPDCTGTAPIHDPFHGPPSSSWVCRVNKPCRGAGGVREVSNGNAIIGDRGEFSGSDGHLAPDGVADPFSDAFTAKIIHPAEGCEQGNHFFFVSRRLVSSDISAEWNPERLPASGVDRLVCEPCGLVSKLGETLQV